MLMFAETGRHAQARTQSPDKSEVIGSSVGLVPSNAHAVRGVSPSKATLVDLFEAARKIVCIPGDESARHDSSFSRPTVRTGSRGCDRWVVTTSRSVYGDGRHNRGCTHCSWCLSTVARLDVGGAVCARAGSVAECG